MTGRDVEERELALRFAPQVGTWTLIGDAADYALGERRRELLDALRAHGSLRPKQAAEITSIGYDLVKVTLWRMARDGQIHGENGRYAFIPPVTPVTPLPNELPYGLLGYRGNTGSTEKEE